jgi:trigger factor
VSEFNTLAEYRDSVKKKLTELNEKREKTANENRVINKVVDLAEVGIPQVMIDSYVDSRIEEFSERLRYQGMDFKEYLSRMGMDVQTMRDQIALDAKREIKTQLVMEKIGKKEEIQATKEDVDQKLVEIAEQMKQDISEINERMSEHEISHIKSDIIFDKTRKLLVDSAVFTKEIPDKKVEEV